MSSLLRVGTVSYLNSVPLNEGLDAHPNVLLTRDVPSRLADDLAAGRLDVALIPVIEVFRHPEYRIVPNVALACRGAVLSVCLFSRVPLEEVRTVALDESSRTSVVLVRILLEDAYGLRPTYTPIPVGTKLNDTTMDAALLIGDPVLKQDASGWHVLDLGQAWFEWTGLPFVFAVWAVRPGVIFPGLDGIFLEAKERGLARIPELAAVESARRGLPEALCRVYLSEYLCYDLDSPAIAGLKRFAEQARNKGLATLSGNLSLWDDSTREGER